MKKNFCVVCNCEPKHFYKDSIPPSRTFYICPNCYFIFEPMDWKKKSTAKEAEFFREQWKKNPNGGYPDAYPSVKILLETCSKSDIVILDFGCGNGGLLRYFRGMGVETLGVDPVPVENDMKDFIYKDLNCLPLKKFDVITGIEVLEHLNDPLSILKQLDTFLVDDGFMFFTTALTNRSMSSMRYFSHWIYRMDNTHVSFYHERTIETLAAKMMLDFKIMNYNHIVFDKRFDRVIIPHKGYFAFAKDEKNQPYWPVR